MCDPIIGGAIIGGIGSFVGGKMQSDAIKDGADAQLKASREQIEFLRENRDLAMKILSPYMKAGEQAQAFANALLYGEGTYGGSSGAGATPDYRAYFEGNNDLKTEWQRLVAGGQAGQFNNDPAAYARWHYDTYGKAEGRELPMSGGEGGDEPNTVTRADVMDLIEQSPLFVQANNDFKDRITEANRLFKEERDIAGNELNKMRGLNKTERDRMLRITQDGYASRKNATDNAIQARRKLTDTYQDQNAKRLAATIGVTGQLGRAQRAADERSEQYSQEFAGTVRDWRNEDFDFRDSGYYGAYGDYFDNERGAYGDFYDNSRAATLRRGSTRANALDLRSAGRAAGYADWTGQIQDQSARGYDAAARAVGAGSEYASGAANATRYGADAYSRALIANGQNQADMWNSIGGYAGEAWEAISNQNKTPSSGGSKYGGKYWSGY